MLATRHSVGMQVTNELGMQASVVFLSRVVTHTHATACLLSGWSHTHATACLPSIDVNLRVHPIPTFRVHPIPLLGVAYGLLSFNVAFPPFLPSSSPYPPPPLPFHHSLTLSYSLPANSETVGRGLEIREGLCWLHFCQAEPQRNRDCGGTA